MESQELINSGKHTHRRAFLGLLFWLLVTFAVAGFGAQFQPSQWYRELAKPEWTPPGYVFGPVWTFLYVCMAVAAWLVWRKDGGRLARISLLFYVGQLLLNGLWSWFFFGRQSISWALIDIAALLILIVVTTVMFWRLTRPAGLLFVPYLLWVSFATVLNFRIWLLN